MQSDQIAYILWLVQNSPPAPYFGWITLLIGSVFVMFSTPLSSSVRPSRLWVRGADSVLFETSSQQEVWWNTCQNGSVLKLELMDNLVMLFSATPTYIRAIRYRVEETSGELCRTANQTLFSHTIFLQNEWKGYRVFLCSSLRIDVRKPKSEVMKVDLIKWCFWYISPLRAFFPDIKVNNNLCPHFLPVPVNSGWDLNCKSTLFLPQIWFFEVFSFSWPVDISVVTSWILVLQIFMLRYRLDCCL